MTFIISTIVLILIAIGLVKRKNVKIHVPVMLAAFVIDVILVLWIELNRAAIEQVAEDIQSPQDHGLLLFHVAVSLISIGLYTFLTILGFKILKGRRDLLKLHRNWAAVFLVCRLANFITSFWVGSP